MSTGTGFNYEITDDNKLVITVDLNNNAGLSKSGKSQVIATSSGNISLPGGVKLGLNVYKPAS